MTFLKIITDYLAKYSHSDYYYQVRAYGFLLIGIVLGSILQEPDCIACGTIFSLVVILASWMFSWNVVLWFVKWWFEIILVKSAVTTLASQENHDE